MYFRPEISVTSVTFSDEFKLESHRRIAAQGEEIPSYPQESLEFNLMTVNGNRPETRHSI